jgi:RHS repeat-associated protein
MQMPGRKYSAAGSGYRYGFNGKELDKDLVGNCYDYGFRIYNPQLGKFLSVDPLTKSYPQMSPYPFAMNDVTRCIDLDGLEKYLVIYEQVKKSSRITKVTIQTIVNKSNEVQDMALKFEKGEHTNPSDEIFVVQNFFDMNGKKREYGGDDGNGNKSQFSKEEKLIYDKGKKRVDKEFKEETDNSIFATIDDGNNTIAKGKDFTTIGDKSILTTGYTSGQNYPVGPVFMYSDISEKVNNQVKELKSVVGNINTKDIIVTITVSVSQKNSANEAKELIKSAYKGAYVSVVINNTDKEINGKTKQYNVTITAVKK